jgi:hypothetical protein
VAAEDRRESLTTYVSAYVAAAKLLTKMGITDLATVAADRAATIAVEADSLSARGMAAYQVVCALLRADRTDEAERLAVGMAETIHRSAAADTPTLASVAGALWLIAAVAAARRTDRVEALARLHAADRLAELVGEDANHAWTAFGPTNVRIHRVTVATELGDPAEALRAAAEVDPTRLADGLRSRRAQVNLDLAWAQAHRKRDAEATLYLLEAERSAPEAIRYNTQVRDLLREMLARSRRPNSVLQDLSVRARARWTDVPDHLALVACGAPLAARVHEVAAAAVEAGWLVRVLATPAALAWVDQAATEQATGYPVLTEQRQPDQAKRFPPPAQVIICPPPLSEG